MIIYMSSGERRLHTECDGSNRGEMAYSSAYNVSEGEKSFKKINGCKVSVLNNLG